MALLVPGVPDVVDMTSAKDTQLKNILVATKQTLEILVAAVNQLQTKVDELEDRVDALHP